MQLHHHFASKFLIETLHKHGFCCSYKEVATYERSAAVTRGTDLPNCTSDKCIQYVADNVDHDIGTIDGKNTFHGMGMIATVTPATSSNKTIPRVTVSEQDRAAVGRVNMQQFVSACDGFQTWKYEKLQEHEVVDPTTNVDLLLDVSMYLRARTPSWFGSMQMILKGNHPGKASIFFLPLIDMSASDTTCLYSTLLYIT